MTDVQGMKDLNLREDTRFQQAPQPDMVSSQVCLDAGGMSMRLTQSFTQGCTAPAGRTWLSQCSCVSCGQPTAGRPVAVEVR
jgi:hypothetical protein